MVVGSLVGEEEEAETMAGTTAGTLGDVALTTDAGGLTTMHTTKEGMLSWCGCVVIVVVMVIAVQGSDNFSGGHSRQRLHLL